MRLRAFAVASLATIVGLPFPAGADVAYFVYTGQSNAQTQIDIGHTSSWNFTTGGTPFTLGGGNFTLKEGPQTVANIALSLYLGIDQNGSFVTKLDLTNAQFDALFVPPVTNPAQDTQSFTLVPFHFAVPQVLAANSQYYLALTSMAEDQQSAAYFIKGYDSFTIQTPGGATPPDVLLETPEPASIGVLAVGLIGLASARHRHLHTASRRD